MIEECDPIKVYAKVDKDNNITAVDSGIFLKDPAGWVEIDAGFGDKYSLAQGNYFEKPLMDEYGHYHYKYIDGKIVSYDWSWWLSSDEFKSIEIRNVRNYECFELVNRGEVWYNTLTEEQKAELRKWYQEWLDAPATLKIPEKPAWLK